MKVLIHEGCCDQAKFGKVSKRTLKCSVCEMIPPPDRRILLRDPKPPLRVRTKDRWKPRKFLSDTDLLLAG